VDFYFLDLRLLLKLLTFLLYFYCMFLITSAVQLASKSYCLELLYSSTLLLVHIFINCYIFVFISVDSLPPTPVIG
jgi:hypothetical protein